MNERIKELAVLSNIEFTHDPTETPLRVFAECWEDELEKFAELIVKECAAQADEESSWPYSSFGKKIKEHFGVEE